nr:hypothetical protein [Tanacetum cinerariifolium]
MTLIQTFLERFNCIPFEEKPQILFQTWETFFAIQCSQPEDSNELFYKLLKDLKELAEYDQSANIHQLIEECSVEVPEEQKQKIEDTMFDLVKICHHKQFLCIHDDVDDLIESALDSKLLSINSIKSQRLDKKEQEVKIVAEHDDESFEDIEYVDASVPDLAIVNVEEENVVQREEEEERLINLMKNDNSDSSNDPLLEEVDLFLSDNSIPPGIENVADDQEGDVRFLEGLLIDDSIL